MIVVATPATEREFAPYGRLLRMAPRERAGLDSPRLVFTDGDGWLDCYTAEPLLMRNGSLGVTLGGPAPFATNRMERHLVTEEALFCMADPVVLVVAAPTAESAPRVENLRAFVLEPGMVAVLQTGTWHDACRGIGKPAHYYWMATVGDGSGSSWVEVVGGPAWVTATP